VDNFSKDVEDGGDAWLDEVIRGFKRFKITQAIRKTPVPPF